MDSARENKSNAKLVIGALVGIAIFGVSTYVVVDQAGGTKVEPGYSNTPNGVTPGAPPFK